MQAGQEGPRTKLGSHSGAGAGGEGAKKISVSTSYRVGIGPLSVSRSSRRADVERGGMVISLYDKRLPDYSPKGKNTVNLTVLQGFDHWQKFEEDYWAGRKDAYNAEKERMARTLIHRAEEALLPGLSKATEVMEIGTPLTNLRLPATIAAPFTAGIRRSTTPGNAAWAPPPRSGTSISPARGHARATAAAPCS